MQGFSVKRLLLRVTVLAVVYVVTYFLTRDQLLALVLAMVASAVVFAVPDRWWRSAKGKS